jgi:hypothetical protein
MNAPPILVGNDFRALCSELTEALDVYADMPPEGLLNRARAALAQPAPEPPTDAELDQLAEIYAGDCRPFARAVLARWGQGNG